MPPIDFTAGLLNYLPSGENLACLVIGAGIAGIIAIIICERVEHRRHRKHMDRVKSMARRLFEAKRQGYEKGRTFGQRMAAHVVVQRLPRTEFDAAITYPLRMDAQQPDGRGN